MAASDAGAARLTYHKDDPFRLWTLGNPFSSHTDVEEAIAYVMALIQRIIDPDELIAAEGRHCVDGSPLMEFTLAGGGPLLCVLYGATWEQWQRHAPEEFKPH